METLLCFPLPEEAELLSQSDIGLTFQWDTATWRTFTHVHRPEKDLIDYIDEAYETHSELELRHTVALEDGEVECYRFTHTFEGDSYPIYCAWHSDGVHDYLLLIDAGQWTPEQVEAQLNGIALMPSDQVTAPLSAEE